MNQEVKQTVGFSWKAVIRLFLFSLFIYLSVSYFSRYAKQPEALNDPTVLGEEVGNSPDINLKPFFDQAYQSLPPDSRQKLENINQIPAIIYTQEKIQYLKDQIEDFPRRQINQLKKEIIQSVYQDLMEDIEPDSSQP